MKLCTDCKHCFNRSWFGVDRRGILLRCAALYEPEVNPVVGPVKPEAGDMPYCDHTRAEDGACGPEAKLYEPRWLKRIIG